MTTAHDKLLARLAEIQHFHPHAIACRGAEGHMWITDKPLDMLAAAEACQWCPAKSACGGYALAAEEPAGIWGGMTPKHRAQTRTSRKRAAAREQKEDSVA